MRTKKTLLVVWVTLFLCGFVLISYLRQEQFEEHLENEIIDIQEEMETVSSELQDECETLDRSSPEDVLLYLGLTTYPYSGDYFLDFSEYMKKKPRGNLFLGTFLTQADEGAFLEGCFTLRVSYFNVRDYWYSETEPGKIFLDSCQQYEKKNQGFSWEEFRNSDDFGQFLNELCNFIEDKEDISLQETYQQIEDLGKIKTGNIYRKALLQSYIYLAETSYSKYQEHKQDDFMKALVDAEVVYTVYDFSQNWDTKQIAFTTLEPFQRDTFFMHSSVLDIGFAFIVSTLIVIAIWIVFSELKKGE
ncbi:MAG: hypothetical protein HXS52_00775 [Theionarchaea archaeon]|nr:hypothetical protein [Theionarchaea archaeon]